MEIINISEDFLNFRLVTIMKTLFNYSSHSNDPFKSKKWETKFWTSPLQIIEDFKNSESVQTAEKEREVR